MRKMYEPEKKEISIHAPRTGSDIRVRWCRRNHPDFNPRSPHGERLDCQGKRVYRSQFQSTLPARGATAWTAGMLSWTRRISIHAPRTGSDCRGFSPGAAPPPFQSTLPARGATFVAVFRERGDLISIHAPRTGSDQSATRRAGAGAYFNPRSPHGERLYRYLMLAYIERFQSTLPARGATSYEFQFLAGQYISIHAPRTGSD